MMTHLHGRTFRMLVALVTSVLTVHADGRDVVRSQKALEQRTDRVEAVEAQINEMYGRLPLSFETNRGQTDSRVDFVSRGSGYSLFVTPTEAVFALSSTRHGRDVRNDRSSRHISSHMPSDSSKRETAVLRMQIVGSNATAQPEGREELPGKVNYFRGNDPARWRTGIRTYAKVGYEDVYPGIDLVYYGNQRHLEYDFIVSPGADPEAIALAFTGAETLELDGDGNLILQFGGGRLTQRAPHVYQEIDGVRKNIPGRYALHGPRATEQPPDSRVVELDRHIVRFEVGVYDHRRPLVIDPVLVYSTYLGGAGIDAGRGIAVDSAGSAYVTGFTDSTDFPSTSSAFDAALDGVVEAFVTKLDPDGAALVYSTYLGGGGVTETFGIAVDSAGSAYVTGYTSSGDFPTTPGAFDRTFTDAGVTYDAFVTKLEASGAALAYSTYLGATGQDFGYGIALDTVGSAYVTGWTSSSDFPTTLGAFDRTLAGETDAFVAKLQPSGAALVYSTYLGGLGNEGQLFDSGQGIAVDSAGSAYITGWTQTSDFPTTPGAFDTTLDGLHDAFVTKLEASGEALAYSTYLGGSQDDLGFGIAVDSSGSAYVAGATVSSDFPTTPEAFDTTQAGGSEGSSDAFVTKIEASGAALVYSTYLGGSANEGALGISVDGTGSAYVTGPVDSIDFPTTPGAVATTFGGGASDVFITTLDTTGGALFYSTYLGGSSDDESLGIAVDGAGSIYAIGYTSSPDFPTTSGGFDRTADGVADAFVVKLGTDLLGRVTIGNIRVVEGNPVGTTEAVFTVTLSHASASVVTVDFATADGTARAGSDYIPVNGTLSFAPGETAQTVTVLVTRDSAVEFDETFVVQLTNPTQATLADAEATGVVVNDDVARISIADTQRYELSGTTLIFELTLSSPAPVPVTVSWSTAPLVSFSLGMATPGLDYAAVSNATATFAPGTTTTSAAVTVYGDSLLEWDEFLYVDLSNPTNAVIDRSRATGTIQNDDMTWTFADVRVDVRGPAKAEVGALIEYEVIVSNSGPATAGHQFNIIASLDRFHLGHIVAAPDNCIAADDRRRVTCYQPMALLARSSLSYRFVVSAVNAGSRDFSVFVRFDGMDDKPSNNSSIKTVKVK